MIQTFEWIRDTYRDSEWKKRITEAMNGSVLTKFIYKNKFDITVDPGIKKITVLPYRDANALYVKVIPKRISFAAVNKMMENNWSDFKETDFEDIELT